MFEKVRKKEIHSVYRHYDELHFIFIRSLFFMLSFTIRIANDKKRHIE